MSTECPFVCPNTSTCYTSIWKAKLVVHHGNPSLLLREEDKIITSATS